MANARQASLPDLLRGYAKNVPASLSEGFRGARPSSAIASTAKSVQRPGSVAPLLPQRPESALQRRGASASRARIAAAQQAAAQQQQQQQQATRGLYDDPAQPVRESSADEGEIKRLLTLYMRQRQMLQDMQKGGRRPPRNLEIELRALDQSLAREVRPTNTLLFQRFDEPQLERLIRAMPYMKLSQSRWIFADRSLCPEWPPAEGDRAFLLLNGTVSLYGHPQGAGLKTQIFPGAVFGEGELWAGDEMLQTNVAAAAQAEDSCIVGVLTTQLLHTAFADRAIGNHRIVQTALKAPVIARISGEANKENGEAGVAMVSAFKALSNYTASVHVKQGQEILSPEPLAESVIFVSAGRVSVRADLHLVEKFGQQAPQRSRLHVFVEKAEGLIADSWMDKLDPYCIVKLGEYKRFQSQVIWNAGKSVKWDYSGDFTYNGEEELELVVMDRDTVSSDDLCGAASINLTTIGDAGWTGVVKLKRPKKTMFFGDESAEEVSGKIYVSLRWELEQPPPPRRAPKEKVFPDHPLLWLEEQQCWGHERVALGVDLVKMLERSGEDLPYAVHLSELRLVSERRKGSGTNEDTTFWKVSGQRFRNFLQSCGKSKLFQKECRLELAQKQTHVKEVVKDLIKKWEAAEKQAEFWGAPSFTPVEEPPMDPSLFRVAYRGVKARICIKNAMNLPEGSWFDKLDPYAIVRFRGSKADFRTSVLKDAGSEPFWDCEGVLTYDGEPALEVAVFDYDRWSADDLIAQGEISVTQFFRGFEGTVKLEPAGGSKKSKWRKAKQMAIIISIAWFPLLSGSEESEYSSEEVQSTGRSGWPRHGHGGA